MTDHAEGAWWRDYFDEDFAAVYRALLDEEATRAEVAALIELLALPAGAAVLDMPCGWGRHALPLAEAGYRVTGVDYSPTLLDQAAAAAREAGVSVRWVRADMREIEVRAEYDAALCLFSSLGYFLSDAEDARALRAAREALRPGGLFLLETMHRDHLVRAFAERDWWPGPHGSTIWAEREFDAVQGISREALRWVDPAGRAREKRYAMRVRSATEWDVLLRSAGLEPLEWLGGWDLSPFEHGSDRLIVLARPTV